MKLFNLMLLLLVIFLLGFTIKRKFPNFSLVSMQGEIVDQTVLKNKKTLISMYHLGCYPAMVLMNDLDSVYANLDTSKYQILGILENTPEHLKQFYSDSANFWRMVRKSFKTKKVRYKLLTECDCENVTIKDSSMFIGIHCRKLSKKVHTKSSPTIILVDEHGRIQKVTKGYIAQSNLNARISWIEDFFKE